MSLDPVTAALDIGGKLIDRLWPDPAQRAAAQLELIKLQQSGDLAQIAVNTEEAKSASLLVSGWRPSVGWLCVASCAWNWLLLPVCTFAARLMGKSVDVTPADISQMLPILVSLLGIGGYRTIEKLNDKA